MLSTRDYQIYNNTHPCIKLSIKAWLINKLAGQSTRTFKYACYTGDLDWVKYLISSECLMDLSVYDVIIMKGYYDMFTYLYERIPLDFKQLEKVIILAAKYNQSKIAKYIFDIPRFILPIPLQKELCSILASNGDLSMLKHIRENPDFYISPPYTNPSIQISIENVGATGCVLLSTDSKRCDWDSRCYKNAIKYKHQDVIKYLVQQKCPMC